MIEAGDRVIKKVVRFGICKGIVRGVFYREGVRCLRVYWFTSSRIGTIREEGCYTQTPTNEREAVRRYRLHVAYVQKMAVVKRTA